MKMRLDPAFRDSPVLITDRLYRPMTRSEWECDDDGAQEGQGQEVLTEAERMYLKREEAFGAVRRDDLTRPYIHEDGCVLGKGHVGRCFVPEKATMSPAWRRPNFRNQQRSEVGDL